jgi:hypothetical protein
MKAEILKLAGVKNEKEFYKKFPTEEAFMAKYGKKLEKLKQAKVGDYISGGASQQFTPLSYSDVSDSVESSFSGISTAERNRQQDLAAKQNASSKGGGLMDMLGGVEGIGKIASQFLGGEDISSIASAIGAKNGKKLKKAAFGDIVPEDALNYMDNGSLPTDTTPTPTGGFADNIFGSQLKSGVNAANPSNLKNMGTWGKIGAGLKQASPLLANQLGPIISGFQEIDAEKKKVKELQKAANVSGLVAQAAATRPEQQKRRYVRPEDSLINPTQPKGSGTNYLAAENGAEIQNTYAPNVIYTDLGYEPLNESSDVKQYGGGGQIGSALGSVAGSFIPIPGASIATSYIGQKLGEWIGGDDERQKQMDEAQDQITANTLNATGSAFAKNIQGANSSVMEEGGWISHDWQPQVIASFGEHKLKDLLKPDPMMDTLRAGGHLKAYTPPSARAMYTGRDLPYQMEDGGQMAMGGDLEVYRGEAEPISTNPYLPNGGETVMFRGPSHDDGGMPISYGNNGVEVEGGEPAMVMKDGGQKDNLVVFGNMYIPDYAANEIGDPKAKGMKFKRYIADLSKQEDKQNKISTKGTDLINSSNTDDPFDLLAFNSGKAMSLGANMKLKSLAEKKMNTAAVQNAILDTAEEHGLDSAELSKKNIAGFGGKFTSAPIAAKGIKQTKVDPTKDLASFVKGISFGERKAMASSAGIKNFTGTAAQNKLIFDMTQESSDIPNTPKLKPYTVNLSPVATMNKSIAANAAGLPTLDDYSTDTNGTDWGKIAQTALTSAVPFIKPKISNALDPSQTYPEMLAASMNQLEPVPMQSYQPIIPSAPSRVSYQDQLNEITAQSRAAEKLAASNPSAAAALFGQVSQAKSKVLADQFRANQAQDQQYNEMRAQVLNDAQLKNLAMFDQQAVRQAEAKSKTKAQAIEIAKSLSDKIAQNKLENKQLAVLQNTFPAYSFTSEGTVYKDPLYQAIFNAAGGSNLKSKDVAPEGYEFETVLKKKKDTAKNGAIVKAFKNF